MKILNNEFYKQVDRITQLTKKVNKDNKQKILGMIKNHSIEIEELHNEDNEHWAIETADLVVVVLCFELLILEKIDINLNSNFSKCFPRFFKKLEET